MKRVALPVWVILAYLRLSYSACPKTWFGLKCQYKCRCTENKCDPLTGTCLSGVRCQPGWFGPACQYVDLAQIYAVVDHRLGVNLVIDGRGDTCLSARKVTLSLAVPSKLSWFRAHVRDLYFLDKLNIQFKELINSPLLACENKRTALVSDTAVDIHCDLEVEVTQVILTFESLQSLCSFYISGGRNVALRQLTSQSSYHDVKFSPAFNAVDGESSPMFDKGTCIHTGWGDSEPTWNVIFDKPRAVNRYVILDIYKGNYADNRLIGFHLTSYDSAGAEVFHFIDRAPTEQTAHTVTSLTKEVQTVSIYVPHILYLCEVEVYGDSVCEPGLYGRDCEHKCNCADSNDTCFVSTGGCPSGCPPGFHGESCTEVCKKGWFGASCQYKCHCVLDLCSPADGSCTQGVSCTSGWFGPSCQYVDLAKSYAVVDHRLRVDLVIDGKENTCLSANEVTLSLTMPLQLSWFRAHVGDSYFLDKLNIQFKEQINSPLLACENKRTALVSDTAVDIHCDLDVEVTQVILMGESLQSLCSFYISGGRNVALRQHTSQSSYFVIFAPASNAVDGDTSKKYANGRCTHTRLGDSEPTWNVTFDKPRAVNRYAIHNRDEGARVDNRLIGFHLTSYDSVGAEVFHFVDRTPTEQTVYTVISLTKEVQTVSIYLHVVDGTITFPYLTLCEVEVYGDSVCEPGMYGRDCEHKCNCADSNDTCFVSTGGCPSGCPPGFHGESCTEVCKKGWFGASCQYKCHCVRDLCSPADGSCTQGVSCTSGWFGPSCQYENLVQSVTLDDQTLLPPALRDSNDNTCIDDPTQKVIIAWTIPYEFTWLRAVVKDPDFLSTLSLQFKTDTGSQLMNCTNQRQAKVSDRAMDIHCDLSEVVKQVIVTGEGVKYLCSLYISGGRNVALKQKTKQTGTLYHNSTKQSRYAVDGNKDNRFLTDSCTLLDYQDNRPTWSVFLSRKLSVNRYVLYNTDKGYNAKQRFLLESFSEEGINVFQFKGLVPAYQNVYTITSTAPVSPISRVNIQVDNLSVNETDDNVTLCEVEIFGDTLCEPGLYGRDCEHKCACADRNDTCFVSTGGCPSGCAPGFRGESCDQACRNGTHGPECGNSCSQFCRTDDLNTTACDHVHGACLHGCKPGYSGSMCYEECDRQTHGHDCNYTCPQHCENVDTSLSVCHHISGVCTQGCLPGYKGIRCDEQCDSQTHGQDCKSTCPQHCENLDTSLSVCHHISGVCTQGCLPGYKGLRCDEQCDSQTHGQDCNSTCPQHCENLDTRLSVCHHISGVCTQGCLPGYKGLRCDEHCDSQTHGQDCNSTCPQHCENLDTRLSVCHHISGVCTQGCLPGYKGLRCDEQCDSQTHGKDCNSNCPQHCENLDTSLSVCHHISGVCTQGCLPGYKGLRCDEQCDSQTHGQDCNSTCPQHCENLDTSLSVCHHISGVCTQGCLPGYKGLRCDEQCDSQTHGQDCKSTCPQHCENVDTSLSVCHHISGVCIQGCLIGYKGLRCDEQCGSRTHGQDCNSTCPQHCENMDTSLSVCHHISGVCTQGCLPGYKGVRCDESKTNTARKEDSSPGYSSTLWAVAGCIIVVLLVVVGLIVLWRFKKLKSYTIWTLSYRNLQKSDSSEMIVTTETSVVDESVFH